MKKGAFNTALDKAKKAAKKASADPKRNPAGKNPYVGSVRVYDDKVIVRPAPDPSASARRAKSRKARATQSSTTRRIIK